MGRTPGHGENQIEAFEAAWSQGLAVVECDVRCMADGHWLVIHDPTLKRTHGLDCEIAGMDGLAGRAWISEPPPLLASVLARTGTGRGLVIEVKPAQGLDGEACAALAAIIRQAPAARELMVISFDADVLRILRPLLPEMPLGLLEDTPGPHPVDVLSGLDADTWWPRADAIQPEAVAACRAWEFPVIAWTARNDEDCRTLAALGVAAFGSDEPVRHLHLLRKKRPDDTGDR
jgi:glycerophosphoryl diester phosphodiesterase